MTARAKERWDGTRILVSGAGGFIGSHLVEVLVRTGAEVRAFVRYTSSGRVGHLDDVEPDVLAELEVIYGDLRDSDAVRNAVRGTELVFHLGALIGIPYSYVHPRETAETNIGGTLNVLLAARDHDVDRVIQTSSSEVYGSARYVPIDEEHPLQAQSPYSATKIAADKLAESFADSYAMRIVVLRPFNTYGPRQSARAVIPTIVTQVLAGHEVSLGNVTPTRDFTYVTDTVDGFIAAASAAEAVGRTINLGTGREIAIRDLVMLISEILGREVAIRSDDTRMRPRDSEVERLRSDNRLAAEILGWIPRTSLRDGVALTAEWIAAHRGRYRVGVYEI